MPRYSETPTAMNHSQFHCMKCQGPTNSVTGVCVRCRTSKCPNPWDSKRCKGTFVSQKADVVLCDRCRQLAKRKLKTGKLTVTELYKINRGEASND